MDIDQKYQELENEINKSNKSDKDYDSKSDKDNDYYRKVNKYFLISSFILIIFSSILIMLVSPFGGMHNFFNKFVLYFSYFLFIFFSSYILMTILLLIFSIFIKLKDTQKLVLKIKIISSSLIVILISMFI